MLKKELIEENFQLVQKYDRLMVSLSMAKDREKHHKTILDLNRFNENKSFEGITKDDVQDIVYKVMKTYS